MKMLGATIVALLVLAGFAKGVAAIGICTTESTICTADSGAQSQFPADPVAAQHARALAAYAARYAAQAAYESTLHARALAAYAARYAELATRLSAGLARGRLADAARYQGWADFYAARR